MTEYYPAYYKSFKCIAGECTDSCCAGWEIDIDDASYEAYMQVGGELGERLKNSIKEYDPDETDGYDEVYARHGFILTDDMRCPFLNEQNLCDLYIELGENSLCEVCTHTPRNYLEYGDMREICISASCPEAARLLYASKDPITFIETKTDSKMFSDEEPSEDELKLASFLKMTRQTSISILQDRSLSLNERTETFLAHARDVQDAINLWQSGASDLPLDIPLPGIDLSKNDSPDYHEFLTRMDIYSGLAAIGRSWTDRITLMYDLFVDENNDGERNYTKAINSLNKHMNSEDRLYEYEHLLVYYAFLLLNRSIDDYDYLTKARLVVMSYLMNRDMDAAIYLKSGSFLKSDREENARIYAREVEHAEENLADLEEELLFS